MKNVCDFDSSPHHANKLHAHFYYYLQISYGLFLIINTYGKKLHEFFLLRMKNVWNFNENSWKDQNTETRCVVDLLVHTLHKITIFNYSHVFPSQIADTTCNLNKFTINVCNSYSWHETGVQHFQKNLNNRNMEIEKIFFFQFPQKWNFLFE